MELEVDLWKPFMTDPTRTDNSAFIPATFESQLPTGTHRASLTPVVAEELKDMAFECTLMDNPVVAAD